MEVLVLTRFNLAIHANFAKLDKSEAKQNMTADEIWLDENYLERRFEIFEKYTLNSLKRQKDQEFHWWVMFHEDTPQRFKDMISEYQKENSFFEAWYMDDESSMKYSDKISERIRKEYNCKELITIRLDNDDAISSEFVQNTKMNFERHNCDVISYCEGAQYNICTKRVTESRQVNNHFLAFKCDVMCEDNHALKFDHSEVLSKYDNVFLDKKAKYQWLEVISETNCVNLNHYRIVGLFHTYDIQKYYPFIMLPWNSKLGWFGYVVKNIFPTLFMELYVKLPYKIKERIGL